MFSLLLLVLAAHAIRPKIANLAKLSVDHPNQIDVCHHISDATAKYPHGTCAQAGDPETGTKSSMCDYNIAAAGWEEGACKATTEYTDGCYGMYDIVFFLEKQDCQICCTYFSRTTTGSSCSCSDPEPEGVCYGVTANDEKFPKGTCSQAGSSEAPSSMCSFNISQGWHTGQCQVDTMYTVPCVGMYDIVFWIAPDDCALCKGMFHLQNPSDCPSAEMLN